MSQSVTVNQSGTVNTDTDVISYAIRGMSQLWDAAYGQPLPPLPTDSTAILKSALGERMSNLPPNVSKSEVSKAASLFLFRKCLPSPSQSPIPGYVAKMSTIAPLVTPQFRKLASSTIPTLFVRGWDREYKNYVERAVVNSSASTELGRGDGGSRTFWHGCRDQFRTACLTGEADWIDYVRKVKVLHDGGKHRLVTIASAQQALLEPLHHMIYDVLVSKSGCVLRGDASVEALRGMRRERGAEEEVFVSGDYEAATDNFNTNNSRLILRLLRDQSRVVPSGIWDLAIDSLTGSLCNSDGDILGMQTNGQMMGNYLSFPLLCLTNLLGVYGALGRSRTEELRAKRLLFINGDDIVFRGTRGEYEKWASYVQQVGLTLSKGKTLVHKRVFSLNSTFFLAGFEATENSPKSRPLTLVPVIRSAKVLATEDGGLTVAAASGRISGMVKGWRGASRERLVAAGFRLMARVYCGRKGSPKGGVWGSLTRNSGLRITLGTLQKMGRRLIKRETIMLHPRFRAMDKWWKSGEERVGGRVPPERVCDPRVWCSVPLSWVPESDRPAYDRLYGEVCVEHCWSGGDAIVPGEKPEDGLRYSHDLHLRMRRVLGLSELSAKLGGVLGMRDAFGQRFGLGTNARVETDVVNAALRGTGVGRKVLKEWIEASQPPAGEPKMMVPVILVPLLRRAHTNGRRLFEAGRVHSVVVLGQSD